MTDLAIFDGETFSRARDGKRLSSQLKRVEALMLDSRWRTLAAIADRCGCSEAGASARLRDLRKPKFGGYTVERDYRGGGLWLYRLIVAGRE